MQYDVDYLNNLNISMIVLLMQKIVKNLNITLIMPLFEYTSYLI
jgi:hypothetical protein